MYINSNQEPNETKQPKDQSKLEQQKNMENQRISSTNHVSAWCLGSLIPTQMAIKAAIELNVFNIIANAGPGAHLSSKDIVSQISTTNPNAAVENLERILRVLSVHSFLSISQRQSSNNMKMLERTYGLTNVSLFLVPNEDGVSLAPNVVLSSEMDIVTSLSMLKDTVLEPGCLPFNKAHGVSIYEHMSGKPELSQLFNKAVGQSSILDFEEVLKVYKGFEEVEELMDVGGGIGTTIDRVVSCYPHIHGINFDLPNVIAQGKAKYPGPYIINRYNIMQACTLFPLLIIYLCNLLLCFRLF